MKNKYIIIFLILLASGIFLRLYKFQEFVMFLGDQGRDAIIIKRIVTLEHFPAIGPTTSIGGVFSGPFFYYLMAPFLLLFRLDPDGLAFGSVLLSVIGLLAAHWIVKKQENPLFALIFVSLIIFSAVQVDFSRFSWNPSLLPIFSFISLFFLYQMVTSKNILSAILFGMFVSFSIQLHYLGGLILLTALSVLSYSLLRAIDKKILVKKIVLSALSFLLFSSPLLIFDLKHNFLNSWNFIKVLSNPAVVAHSSSFNRFLETITAFFSHVAKINIPQYIALFIFLGLIIYFIKNRFFKNNIFLQMHFLNFFLFLISFSFFNSFRHPHYYGLIYYSFYFIVTYFIYSLVKKSVIKIPILIILLAFYLFLNAPHYTFLYKEGNNQIEKAKTVAESVIKSNPLSPYQVVGLPYTESVGNVRYFLEIKGYRPLPEENAQEPRELYVLCRLQECNVLNDRQWQIAAFTDKKLAGKWKADEFIIYKLIHGK